jgi:hypothetical protein
MNCTASSLGSTHTRLSQILSLKPGRMNAILRLIASATIVLSRRRLRR